MLLTVVPDLGYDPSPDAPQTSVLAINTRQGEKRLAVTPRVCHHRVTRLGFSTPDRGNQESAAETSSRYTVEAVANPLAFPASHSGLSHMFQLLNGGPIGI